MERMWWKLQKKKKGGDWKEKVEFDLISLA